MWVIIILLLLQQQHVLQPLDYPNLTNWNFKPKNSR